MTKSSQIFAFIILLMLTFAVSTAMAFARHRICSNRGVQPDSIATPADSGLCLPEPPVRVSDSMPATFRNTSANVIIDDSLLAPAFDTLSTGIRPLHILHIGDSHVAPGTFTHALEETLQRALPESVEVRFFGHNGATVNYFATTEWMEKIRACQPDLIIVSLGTNECHGMGYHEEQHRGQMQAFYPQLAEACPQAVILLTTPPGDYLSVRTGRRRRRSRASQPNPMTIRAAAEICHYGSSHGMAVWDLHTIVGGQSALPNWIGAGLMQNDRVHFTPEGYQLQGHLLGEALLRAYNDYATRP